MMGQTGSVEAEHPKTAPSVLVVETSKLVRDVVAKSCARRGVATEYAAEVGEALNAIGRRRPAAVITALELPVLSGVALIAALRSTDCCRDIPIGLLTSTSSSGVRLKDIRPDAVIVKDNTLSQAVGEFLASQGIGSVERSGQESAGSAGVRGRILLAEDTLVIQKLLGKILRGAGADLTIVGNGVQAVAAASAESFDLILMDIEMPEMDGCEAARRLRSQGCDIPIIALTAHDSEGYRRPVLEAGADCVLSKPVDRHVLVETCRQHITRARKRPKGGGGAPGSCEGQP